MKKTIFLIMILLINFSFAVEFVKPELNSNPLLILIPNAKYTVSFIDTENKLHDVTVYSDMNFDIRKEGPYYFSTVYAISPGDYHYQVVYYDDNKNIIRDLRLIQVTYDVLDSYLMMLSELKYHERNPVSFIFKNNADVDVNILIYSDLPNFKEFYVIIPARSTKKVDSYIVPLFKGAKKVNFYYKIGSLKKRIGYKEVYSKFNIKQFLKDNFYSSYFLNPYINLFGFIRAIFSFM